MISILKRYKKIITFALLIAMTPAPVQAWQWSDLTKPITSLWESAKKNTVAFVAGGVALVGAAAGLLWYKSNRKAQLKKHAEDTKRAAEEKAKREYDQETERILQAQAARTRENLERTEKERAEAERKAIEENRRQEEADHKRREERKAQEEQAQKLELERKQREDQIREAQEEAERQAALKRQADELVEQKRLTEAKAREERERKAREAEENFLDQLVHEALEGAQKELNEQAAQEAQESALLAEQAQHKARQQYLLDLKNAQTRAQQEADARLRQAEEAQIKQQEKKERKRLALEEQNRQVEVQQMSLAEEQRNKELEEQKRVAENLAALIKQEYEKAHKEVEGYSAEVDKFITTTRGALKTANPDYDSMLKATKDFLARMNPLKELIGGIPSPYDRHEEGIIKNFQRTSVNPRGAYETLARILKLQNPKNMPTNELEKVIRERSEPLKKSVENGTATQEQQQEYTDLRQLYYIFRIAIKRAIYDAYLYGCTIEGIDTTSLIVKQQELSLALNELEDSIIQRTNAATKSQAIATPQAGWLASTASSFAGYILSPFAPTPSPAPQASTTQGQTQATTSSDEERKGNAEQQYGHDADRQFTPSPIIEDHFSPRHTASSSSSSASAPLPSPATSSAQAQQRAQSAFAAIAIQTPNTQNRRNALYEKIKKHDADDKNTHVSRYRKSWALFGITRAFNTYILNNAFTYHRITDAPTAQDTLVNGVYVQLDAAGNILRICDNKSPLILGSIPSETKDIEKLKKEYQLKQDAEIGVHRLNQQFECDWAGLTKLTQDDQTLKTFKYPTYDYGPTSFIDLIRAVRDLENRSNTAQQLAYVHCKAGRGRSALVVAAYLAYVCHKAGAQVTPQALEAFIKGKRPVIGLHKEQQELLQLFCEALEHYGSFDNIYTEHKEAIQARDKEVQESTTSAPQQSPIDHETARRYADALGEDFQEFDEEDVSEARKASPSAACEGCNGAGAGAGPKKHTCGK
ncbi:MAG: hypothetical protein NTX86_04660 [Candidatus Dependentiae bacterium]|nr:hypothetical protein [Candidatus Dependentiae bacterium]